MEKLVLVDGNSLINRAFYALPILTNSSGEYCNALYGFCNLIFVTDNTFRKNIYNNNYYDYNPKPSKKNVEYDQKYGFTG